MSKIQTTIFKAVVLIGLLTVPQVELFSATKTWNGSQNDNDMHNHLNWGPSLVPVASDIADFPDLGSPTTANTQPSALTASMNIGTIHFTASTTQYNVQNLATSDSLTAHFIANQDSSNPQQFTLTFPNALIIRDGGTTNGSSAGGSITYNVTTSTGALVFQGNSPYNSGLGGNVAVTNNGGVISTAGSPTYTIQLASLSADSTAILDFKNGNDLEIGNDNSSTQIAAPICTTAGTTLSLTKTGTGTVTLVGTQNFISLSAVTQGTLVLQDGAIPVKCNFSNSTSTTLSFDALSGPFTYSNAIVGGGQVDCTGAFVVANNNVVTLSGANAYTGATQVLNGSQLQLDNAAIAVPSAIFVDAGGVLYLNATSGPQTYQKVLSGTGELVINGSNPVTLTGASTFSGSTTIKSSQLTLQDSAIQIPSDITLTRNNGTVLEFDAVAPGPYTYANVISDSGTGTPGTVTKAGAGTVTLTGANTYTGTTNVTAGLLIVQDAAIPAPTNYSVSTGINLEFDAVTNSSYTYGGIISGLGGFTNSGSQQVILTGANNYTGTTSNNAGTLTLKDAAAEVPSNINTGSGTTLEFNITTGSRTYGNVLSGGTILKTGSGKLIMTQANTVDQMTISAGEFNLPSGSSMTTQIGNPLLVQAGALLTGTGAVRGGGLTVQPGGTIQPGNSPGTLSVDGPCTLMGTYNVQIDGPTNANTSLIHVTSGLTTLNNSTVALISASGLDLNQKYNILTTDGNALTDEFNPIVNTSLVSPYFSTLLEYDSKNVFLVFQTAFTKGAQTPNEEAVAEQLDSITSPSPFLNDVLIALAELPQPQFSTALAQMSGEQYTATALLAQDLNHQFIRRLYNPLRALVNTSACACNPCGSNSRTGWSVWGDVSGGGARLLGDLNCSGLNLNAYEITAGMQTTVEQFTWGLAGSYANSRVRYNIGGKENINSYFGGFYALYRPKHFYVLADFTYGHNKGRMYRSIDVGTTYLEPQSTPEIIEYAFYGEMGVDICYCDLALQPFIGVEVNRIWRKKVTENNALDFNLTVNELKKTYTLGSLGIHLAQSFCDYAFGFDLAWIYRFTEYENTITNQFATFGTPINIEGVPVDRNSVEGTLYVTKQIGNGWNLYGELAAQVWNRFLSYDALVGIQTRW